MKTTIFLILTIIALLTFAVAALVLTIALNASSAGMIAVFYLPMLTTAFGVSLLALLLKTLQKIQLGKVATVFHYLNIAVLTLSICGFIHLFFFD